LQLNVRFIGLIDKSAARRGIIVHPDKLGSAARKVSFVPTKRQDYANV
jgi:hypothetical protein